MKINGWHEELALGDVRFDAAHRALYEALARLAATPPERFATAFHATVAALERDFRAEEDEMERIAYVGLPSHREQHARALSGLHHAAAALAEGDAGPARRAVALLADWLDLHIRTLDQAFVAVRAMMAPPAAAPR